MPTRDPHQVLGVERGASQATIKAAWRRLARENHPDVIGSDATTARAATRRMAAINAAYEELRASPGRADRRSATGGGDEDPKARRRGGPPPPRPSRPVTGRVDTGDTFRPRNRTTTGGTRGHHRTQPPPRPLVEDREPPRASDPSGPLRRSRRRGYQAPEPPPFEVASATELDFGKFRGHTLGEVAAFEPTYIDWIAATITRDASLVAAARTIRDDLDRRGVVRRVRETERQQRDRLRHQAEWRRIFADGPSGD